MTTKFKYFIAAIIALILLPVSVVLLKGLKVHGGIGCCNHYSVSWKGKTELFSHETGGQQCEEACNTEPRPIPLFVFLFLILVLLIIGFPFLKGYKIAVEKIGHRLKK